MNMIDRNRLTRTTKSLARFLFAMILLCISGVSLEALAQGPAGTGKPPKPATAITQTHNCGSTVLEAVSDAPLGHNWYWQTSGSGTDKSHPADNQSTYSAGSSGYYYIRAYNGPDDLWSDESLSVEIAAADFLIEPSVPATVSVSNNCGNAVLTRSSPPSGVTWYWQSTDSGTSTSNSSVSVTRTSGSTYYLRAQHNTSACWSDARTASYAIQTVPGVPNATVTKQYQPSATTMTRTDAADPLHEWFWQLTDTGTETGATYKGQTYTMSSGSTIYLRAKHKLSGCWSGAQTVTYQVYQNPSPPNDWTILDSCGEVRIERGTPPANETWYWQTTPGGQSLANDGLIITLDGSDEILNNGKHYLRSRHGTFGFWSSAVEIAYSIEEVPDQPAISNHTICNGNTETIVLNPLAGNSFKWYTVETDGTPFHTGNSYTTPVLINSTAYYISEYNTTTGCESTRATMQVVVVAASEGGTITGSSTGFGQVVGTLLVSGVAGDIMWQKKIDASWIDTGNFSTILHYNETEDTEYRVRAINGYCEPDYSSTVTNTVYPNPVIASHGGWVLDYQGQVVLTVSPVAYDSYQWIKNGSDLAGQTSTSHQTGVPDSYQIRVTKAGLSKTSEAVVLTAPVVALDYNEVTSYQAVDEGLTQFDDLNVGNQSKFRSASQYLDGLGRTVQQVSVKTTTGFFDLVQPIEYDHLGRAIKKHLPYALDTDHLSGSPLSDGSFKSTMLTDQDTYYDGVYGAGDYAFSETTYDNSPLNRPLKTYAPGAAWAKGSQVGDRPVSFSYGSNVAGEVLLFELSGGAVIQSGHYLPEKLSKTTTTDENGKQVQEFKNLQGQVILKKVQLSDTTPANDDHWLQTYYVYDDLGNLRFVLPPAALKLINN